MLYRNKLIYKNLFYNIQINNSRKAYNIYTFMLDIYAIYCLLNDKHEPEKKPFQAGHINRIMFSKRNRNIRKICRNYSRQLFSTHYIYDFQMKDFLKILMLNRNQISGGICRKQY